MIRKVEGLYFSPEGGTALMTESLVEDITDKLRSCGIEEVNGECRDISTLDEPLSFDEDTVVVLGIPTYIGKLPLPAIRQLRYLKGGRAMTLALVSYGGRSYGNALYELHHLADDRGFEVIGAGAFGISYSAFRDSSRNEEAIIDEDVLAEFAKASTDKIKRLGGCEIEGLRVRPAPLQVRGRRPVHGISRLSPTAAAIAENLLETISFRRRDSEWFL